MSSTVKLALLCICVTGATRPCAAASLKVRTTESQPASVYVAKGIGPFSTTTDVFGTPPIASGGFSSVNGYSGSGSVGIAGFASGNVIVGVNLLPTTYLEVSSGVLPGQNAVTVEANSQVTANFVLDPAANGKDDIVNKTSFISFSGILSPGDSLMYVVRHDLSKPFFGIHDQFVESGRFDTPGPFSVTVTENRAIEGVAGSLGGTVLVQTVLVSATIFKGGAGTSRVDIDPGFGIGVPVPEPSTMLLAVVGAVAIRRRVP
jgi:hypothetical protein